ncbi:lonely Cys domain-containing protein [Streptomyces sp. NPDC020996]|uniref:lonely Cys domain-containing protein n=1 Tax=Streptomyces sp. NPDC020996 TaxID=3154791 RepID=UPI0033D464DC
MAIMFPPGLREFIEVWVGANVATGNEDLGFASRNPYKRLADDVQDLSDAMKGAISTAGNSLPPRIAHEFVAAMRVFVDDNGQNHLQKFSDELRKIGAQQVDRSIKLSEAKYQILLEFILMNIELALIAALSVFTGGTSLTEIAVQKARTSLAILLILQRLGRAIPTPLSVLMEAIEEAFVSFAAQLISMTAPDDPDRRRKKFDWTDIGQSAVAGALAGLFGSVFSSFGGPIVRNLFKNNHKWKEAFDLPFTFLNEGQAETFAEAFTGLFFLGTFTLNPGTFLSAGLSGLVFETASSGVELGGKWLNNKFFQKLDFGSGGINHLPGGGVRHGNGSASTNRYGYGYGNQYDTYGNGSTYRNTYDDTYTYTDTGASSIPSNLSDSHSSVSYTGDTGDTASVFSDTGDVPSLSSLPDYGTVNGVGGDVNAYGLAGATGAGRSSYSTPEPDGYEDPYRDSLVDDPDADTVFSTLDPSVTGNRGTGWSADADSAPPVNRTATVGSSAPDPLPSRTAGSGFTPDADERRRPTEDDVTTRPTSDGQQQQPIPPAPLATHSAPAASATTSPGQASQNAVPQQRPQTTPSGDPAVTVEPSDSGPVAPDDLRTPEPGESGQSQPSSTAPKSDTRTTADVPPPYRPVRTESEEPPVTSDSPAEPAPAVSRDAPHSRPVAVDETPLSSQAPADIPTGDSSEPGSPDSVDMIMDWEDDQEASEPGPEPDVEPDPAAEALYDRVLTDVFGPGIAADPLHPALRDALTHLDRLRQADPVLRNAPFDLDDLTRRVLLLDRAAAVTDAQRSELFRVVMDPAAESAGSLAALAAFHLELRGVLSPTRTLTAGDGGVRGRNWTNAGIPDLDLTEVGKVARQPDGTLGRGDVRPAPWYRPGDPEPYVVMAEGDHERIVVRGYDGAPRQVPLDVFAELLARDPRLAGLSPDTPVVLLVPDAGARGLDLPRRAADRVGREVWSANGTVKVSPQRDPSQPYVVSLLYGEGLPRADWIRSTPGQVLDPAERENAPDWERDVRSHSVVTDRGSTIGRGVFEDSEAPRRIAALRLATESSELWHYDPATGESAKDDEPVPFAGKPVYVFGAHARPGATRVPTTTDPRHHARQRETGGMLKRRPSLARLPEDHAVLMEACSSAKPPGVVRTRRGIDDTFVPDPLAVVSESQHVANETGRTAYGGTHMVSFATLPDGKFVHRLYTDSRGRRGRWVEHRPEPTGALLDDRARAAGLHTDPTRPVSDGTRERTLRLVRALRQAFGAAIEDDSRYGDLLAGIGALETMRAADPVLRDLGPFSMDLFERAAHANQQGGPGTDAYRDLLTRAVDAVRRQPDTVFSDFVPLPHVTAAAQRLGGLPEQELDAEAARVLRLDGGPAAVGDLERARLFWATVKALEWESRTPDPDALTGRILHLEQPDPSRRPDLLDLVAQAAAVGVDVDNPTELAAFHLESLGALSPETQLRDAGGAPVGRRWAQAPPSTTMLTDRVVVAAPKPGGGYQPVSQERPPWSAPGGPSAYTVWAGGGRDHLLMNLPGGFRARVPYEEVAELLARDPVLNTLPMDGTDIVLAVSKAAPATGPSTGPAPAADPRTVISGGTGRAVWASQGSVALAGTGPSRPYVATLLPTAPGRPAAADWSVVRPGDPAVPGTRVPTGGTGADDVTFADRDGDATASRRDPGTAGSTDVPLPDRLDDDLFGDPAETGRVTAAEEIRYRELLADLYGPGILSDSLYPVLRDGLARLDRLRRADPLLDYGPLLEPGPLDLDAVARRVLLLDLADLVTDVQRSRLLGLVTAQSAQSAGSLAALSALHLQQQGVLSPTHTMTTPDGRVRGRDWTTGHIPDLDLTNTGRTALQSDGGLGRADVRTAPWHRPGQPEPYVVRADGNHEHVVVRGFDGAPREVPLDVFAELLALDPELAGLPADVPVVLLIPGAGARGLELPRRAADRAGRDVWSADGAVDVTAQQDPSLPHVVSLRGGRGRLRTAWIRSTPGQVLGPAESANAPFWEQETLSHTIVTDRGPIGRGVFRDTEDVRVLEDIRHATTATDLYHHNPFSGEWTKDDQPVPFAGKPVYVFAAHGLPGETHLPTRSNPNHRARQERTGGMLKRRPSLARLPEDHAVVMEACFSAAPPGLLRKRRGVHDLFVPDPLGAVSESQHVANETGRTVYGGTHVLGFARRDGKVVHHMTTDARGRHGTWVEHRPEPTGTLLDDRARAAGLHPDPVGPASQAVRERTLRLVRALRLTFGVAVEDDRRYGELLQAIGAFEIMRHADPVLRDNVPFSLDLFERAAREIRATEHADVDGELGPDAYRDLLARAVDVVRLKPGAVLTDFVTLPHVTNVAEGLAGLTDQEVNDEAAQLLGLDPDLAVIGAPERARLFWATVQTLEWERRTPDPAALTARLLHLDRPDPVRVPDLLDLVRGAAAVGVDLHSPTELAAFHLESLGALSPDTMLFDDKGAPAGRHWVQGSSAMTVDVDSALIMAATPDGGYRPMRSARMPWTADTTRPTPYLVWGETGPDHLTMNLPGGLRVRVPYEEVAELLARDPGLNERPRTADIVLATPPTTVVAQPTPQNTSVLSTGTGRGVWTSPGAVGLLPQNDPSRPHVLSLLPVAAGRRQWAHDWSVVRPGLQPSANAPVTTLAAGTPSGEPDLTVNPVPKPPKADPPSPDRPQLDPAMAPPARNRRAPARFADGRQMPLYVDDLQSLLPSHLTAAELEQLLASPSTFGQSTVVLRGVEQALDAIDRELRSRPDARPAGDAQLLDDVRRTLRDKPKTLADGEGRPFPYVNADGKRRVLWVRARHHGNWAPFDDGIGDSTKIDSMHRAAATFGLTKNMQANSQYGLGGPIGPASTAASGGFGRLALRFGFINKVGYTLTDQRMNQMETRTLDKSRSYLDDIHYEIRVTDTAGRVVTGIVTGTGTGTGTDPAAPARFAFGMRKGLLVRLPDSVTKIPKPGRIPRSITLDRNSQYRFVRIEGFGPVAAIRDWAAGQLGALPGSSAYTELDIFFSGDSFQRHGGTMARGRITTPPLFADDKKKSPLGVFVVEELIPQAAVLVGETDQAEMRDINTSTVRSERSRSQGRSLLLQAVAGPAFNFADPGTAPFDLRLQFGPTAQYAYAKTWSVGLGAAGTLKSAGQVKGPKTALYLVVKSVRVRRAGDSGPPTRFLTWSLDRMTSSEARRLAGWDDGTTLALRNGAAPPLVPAYLTVDRPRTLGMHRVKEFAFDDGLRTRVTPDTADGVGRTLLDAFADGVVDAISHLNQGLVVPLDQLLPPNLPKGWRARLGDLLKHEPDQVLQAAQSLPMPPRWTDPVKYRIALQNTLQVLGVLSQQNVTANLEALTTIGLPVRLADPDSVGQTHYTVRAHGTLTGRRYEGKDVSEGMRFSALGNDRLDGQTSAKRGLDLGIEGTFSGRDNNVDDIAGLRRNTLGLTLGARQGWQWEGETTFGSTVTNEPMSVSNQPTHLYRYDLSLTATMSGYWRPRGLVRGLGLGLPGLLVLDEPVNVLFGRTALGHLRGGGPMTGQVLIGVPVQHTPDADPYADGALNPYLSDEPAPTSMTTERALALAKGDLVLPAGPDASQPAGRLAERGTQQFKEFRQHPFVIVNMVLSPTLIAEVDRVLRTASGSAWQLVKEGAPTRDAIVRTFTPQHLSAGFDQSSGPLGLAGSGLLGKGPYGELWGTFRYATTVGNLHALTPPMSMDTEMTLGSTRQAAGKISNSTSFVFGGQLVYLAARNPGHGLMGGYGIVANPFSTSRAHSRSVIRTVVADMNRKGLTHQVLVAGDVQHWFALLSSRLGTGRTAAAAAAGALVPRSLAGAAGTAVTSPGGLLGHLPEKSAHRMGLIDDGLGDVPRYTGRLWTPQPWMRGAAFGTYAVNALDPTDVLLAFDRRIRELGLDEQSRERIRQLVTGRATRALKGEMTTTGPSTLVKAGGWGWDSVRIGSRLVRARVELIPGTPVFDGLDHSAELEENRRAIETAQENSESSSGADVGLLTSQLVYTGNAQVAAAGPTYTEGGSNRKTVASSHTVTTVTIYRAASTEPHAEIVTPYRMRITLEADDTPDTGAPAGTEPESGKSTVLDRFRGRLRIVEEGDVGELREHVPLSLMEPAPSRTEADGTGASGPDRLLPAPDPAADPALAGPPRPVPLSRVGEVLTVRDGDGVTRTFTFPENGMHPRGIIGIENIRMAGDLVLTRAYDVGFSLRALEAEDGPDDDVLTELLRRTRETGLTRPGTGSAQALEDGTSSMAITAFFPRTTEPAGYQVAGLTEKSLVGTDSGRLTLRSAPDFSRALLLTVADGKKLEVFKRHGDNAGTSSSVEHSQSSGLGGAFLYDSPDNAGLNQIGVSGSGPNDLDGDGLPVGDDHLTSRNLKPKTGRSFLFAVPATWLSVGDVHRSVVDSKLANRIRGGTFAKARSGPQAMRSEAYVVTWIREDVARELRIITDTNFPASVSKAWDAVESASKAWVDADKAYWKKRRASGGLRADLDAAQTSLDRAARTARAATRPVDLARADADAADTALRRAESDARRDHAAADAAVAAARADVDAFAEDEYAAPEHDGWAEVLRDEQDAALARLADAEEAAGKLRKAADLRLETARTEKAAAGGRLDAALLSARAPGRALDEATARRDTARDAFEARRAELDALKETAEKAAAEYHRVRSGADQLTRWHRLAATAEGREQLDGLAEPPAVTYQAPPKAPKPKPPAPPRYTRTGSGPGSVLTSPTNETYTLQDVPRDGDAFFRALALGLEHAAPGLLAAQGIDPDGPRAVSALRRRMASWLTDHADEDLLAAVAPDHTDAFSAEEIAAAGLDLGTGTPARREFDGLGGLIPHAVGLSPEVRAELAVTQLLRPGDAESEAGWNHAASDLLPLLAARSFGVRVTVVGSDGAFQDFTPGDPTGNLQELVGTPAHSGAHVVLSLDDHHYRLALPATAPTPPKDGKALPPTGTDALPEGADALPEGAEVLRPKETAPLPPKDTALSSEGAEPLPRDGQVLPPTGTDALPEGAEAPALTDTAALPPKGTDPLPSKGKQPQSEPVGPEPRPSDVPPQGEGEKGSEPEHDSGRARGRRVPVPGTGECLLYSFMAGDPVHIRSRLVGLVGTDRAAYDWLGDPDSVRAELRRQAEARATTGKAPAGPSQAALQAMRAYVEDYVERSAGRLHPQIIGQFRQTVADAFAADVRKMDRAGMLALLGHHGVQHVPVPEAVDPAELLRRYVDARTASEPADPGVSAQAARAAVEAEAGELSPRRMFEHLERQGLLPMPDDLDDEALYRLLSTIYVQSTAPLDDTELSVLTDAVVNWEQSWGTPAGETFLPLLAHAFGLRVDVVRQLPSGARRISGAGPDEAMRQTEVYYNGVNHYDGSDAGARDRFGDPVLPKRIKDEERDQDGDVRLNPLWVPLDEVDPDLLITGNRDAVWLYTVTDDGRVILGTEDLSGIITPEQFDALLAGMREKDPDLTAESLREALDGLGHTGIAAGFVGDGVEKAGRTLPGRSRVSGEFRWSEKLRSWVVNDKSGRYMSETVRPDLDAAEAADWLTNAAALFSARLGVVVRTEQVKTAATVPAPAPPTEPALSAPPPPPSAPAATPAGHGAPAPLEGAGPGTPSVDDTGKLDVARRVGAVLHGLGHPVVLAGAARGRVQFGQSRPLGAVEFRMPAAALPAVDGIRGALEREMPGASVRVWPVTGGGRVLGLSVNGVDITVTAVDRPAPGTVTVDGFTVPAPADSLADAALALATGTDPELRGRDLLDLLWALHRTPAESPRTVTPVLAREDDYGSARPTGAAGSLAVRLSELLDSAALDADALARHEETWRALGVTDADLPALRGELTALADGLRVRPEVTADPVRALAARLPGLATADSDTALALLPPADRERLAADPVLVDALRAGLPAAEFASVAARLMTQVPDGVEQPVTAGDRARAQVARLLQAPDVAARLLKGGSRVVVVPRSEAMTSLDAFRHLRGAVTGDGRSWDDVRGVGARTAAVTEENLLGERTTAGTGPSAYPDGYSTTLHEFAHTVHQHGLDAVDRQRITNTFRTTTRAGEAGNWPDGPLYGYDADGRRSAPNYSSRDELEFFAQLTNVYLMANGGNDPYTGLPRNNAGPEWVRTRQPALYPLLRRLYGEGPRTAPRHPRSVEPARPRGARPADVNPVEATDVENEALARARALWDVAEDGPGDGSDSYVAVRALWDGATGAHAPQPHTPAPLPSPFPTPVPEARSAAAPPPTDNAVQQRLQELWAVVDATFGSQPLPPELRNGLFNSLRLIESARVGHPRFGAGLDLDGITRMLLHLAPDAPVDAARHYDALSLASAAQRRGRAGSLDAIAAYGLTRQGYVQQSLLSGGDGAPHGRNWSGRPGIRLNMDVVADSRGVHPAPWGSAAYATVAERNDEGVVLADGRPVSDEEFAELVLHDPQRQPGVPVVILIGEEDGRNEALARVIADRTGTRVWFTYGRLLLEAAPDGRRVPVLAAPAFGSDPAGTWIPADPGLVPDDPAATVRAANGTVFPDADIHSYPLVTVDGQALTGRAFLDAHDMALREEALRVVSAVQHYTNEVEGLPGVYPARQGGLLPLPQGLAGSYVFVGHGDSGRTTVPRRSTRANQAVHPRHLGRMLARRRSLQALSPEAPVWLLICEMSMTRPDQDLLTHPSSAQYVANETRRTVFAVDRQVSPSEAEGGLPPRLVLDDDPDRPVGHVEEFLPEPRTVALDALADLGGLPAQVPARTERALHWVRALRQTHGVHIDSDPAREAEFHELIEGFGALEGLRFQAAGNADPGPLTWGGLRHIVGQYAARQGWDRSLTAGSLAHLLHAARAGRLRPSDASGPSAPAAPPASTGTPPADDTAAHRSRTSPPETTARSAGSVADVITAGGGTPPPTALSEDAQRQWIARQVAQEDLPGNPPGLTGADMVTLAELRDAGIEITPGMDVEAQLGGGVRGSGLAPLDQVRLLLARPGPWPEALDAVAETVARRIWRSAFTEFDGAVPGADAVRAWDTALGLVLPGEPSSAFADWRYAGEGFRDAVRRLAVLLAERADPRTVARVAARLRESLGLPPPGTEDADAR